MRIWDQVPPHAMCRQHLLGEWRESWGLHNILTHDKKGYRNHPETKRWIGREAALYRRMMNVRAEMLRRGYNAKPMPPRPGGEPDKFARISVERFAFNSAILHQRTPPTWDDQLATFNAKARAGCGCTPQPNPKETPTP